MTRDVARVSVERIYARAEWAAFDKDSAAGTSASSSSERRGASGLRRGPTIVKALYGGAIMSIFFSLFAVTNGTGYNGPIVACRWLETVWRTILNRQSSKRSGSIEVFRKQRNCAIPSTDRTHRNNVCK